MKAEETHTGSLEFNNDYTAKGSTVLTAKKELKGRTVAAGQFTFQLKDDTGAVVGSAKNNANGSFTIQLPTYSQTDAGKDFVYALSRDIDFPSATLWDFHSSLRPDGMK